MAQMTFEEVAQQADKLSATERMQLIARLEQSLVSENRGRIMREMILADHDRKVAEGAFDNVESLYGKYANPELEITEEELNAYLHEIATEWEKEMDELVDDD